MRVCPDCRQTYPDETNFCPRDGTALPSVPGDTQFELAAGLARSYRIIRRLGAGSMGEVFLAEQIELGGRLVAVKVLFRKLLDGPEFRLRFHNEAAVTARIHHPSVVAVYESGQPADGPPYIAMEYLEGATLREALSTGRALPLAVSVEIIRQVAQGLNAAHKIGILHGDLKPGNIFLARADDAGGDTALPGVAVKVMDFGTAKLRESSSSQTIWTTELGTPAYMSYEQAWGMRGEALDHRSDIYSLGVVVYEMLTGRLPFQSDTPLGYVDPAATNSKEAGAGRLIPMGSLPKNKSPFGALDMSGNVWEWTADDYTPYPGREPAFAIPGNAKVIRGGCYRSDRFHVTTTARSREPASTQSSVIGFRCAKSP
jgi:eukaryotic-like serine/threonine-protein kinase